MAKSRRGEGESIWLTADEILRIKALVEPKKEIDEIWAGFAKKLEKRAQKYKEAKRFSSGPRIIPECPVCHVNMPYDTKQKAAICPACGVARLDREDIDTPEAWLFAQENARKAKNAKKKGSSKSGRNYNKYKPKYEPGTAAKGINLDKPNK